MKYPTTVSIVGNTFMAVAFLIMGPVPFINLETSVPLIQVNLLLCMPMYKKKYSRYVYDKV